MPLSISKVSACLTIWSLKWLILFSLEMLLWSSSIMIIIIISPCVFLSSLETHSGSEWIMTRFSKQSDFAKFFKKRAKCTFESSFASSLLCPTSFIGISQEKKSSSRNDVFLWLALFNVFHCRVLMACQSYLLQWFYCRFFMKSRLGESVSIETLELTSSSCSQDKHCEHSGPNDSSITLVSQSTASWSSIHRFLLQSPSQCSSLWYLCHNDRISCDNVFTSVSIEQSCVELVQVQ